MQLTVKEEKIQQFVNSPFAGEKFWLGRETGVQISVDPSVEADRTRRMQALARGHWSLPTLEAQT